MYHSSLFCVELADVMVILYFYNVVALFILRGVSGPDDESLFSARSAW